MFYRVVDEYLAAASAALPRANFRPPFARIIGMRHITEFQTQAALRNADLDGAFCSAGGFSQRITGDGPDFAGAAGRFPMGPDSQSRASGSRRLKFSGVSLSAGAQELNLCVCVGN